MNWIRPMLMIVAVGLLASTAQASAPVNLYTITDTTVTDTGTRLTWQRNADRQQRSWAEASTYCERLNLGGFSSGWRLPRKKELELLVDRRANPSGAAIDAKAFPGAMGVRFWTSTPMATDSGKAWYVDFSRGSTYFDAKTEGWFVRCVRG